MVRIGIRSAALVTMLRPVVDAPDFAVRCAGCVNGGGIESGAGICIARHAVAHFHRTCSGIDHCAGRRVGRRGRRRPHPERWRSRLDPRMQAVSYSVLPLGRQVLKLTLFLIAILSGVERLGLQHHRDSRRSRRGRHCHRTCRPEDHRRFFGGISVISDRPVLVGDVCRFGDRTGTVMHIGLRSTRIRTPDRTVVSVPNGQFATMTLENISGRDKIWFHPILNLRRDTTSDQMLRVLESCREILSGHPKVEAGKIPVRFVGVGAYSLDIEVVAYVKTSDYDEFLAIQQELLLQILRAVNRREHLSRCRCRKASN